jgi:holo-[acyl-carrier protein] synthase
MGIGIGNDLVELSRIKRAYHRFGKRLLRKVLSEGELKILPPEGKRRISFIAGRWSAKEAISKALGYGISGGIDLNKNGLPLTDIEVLRKQSGAPKPVLHHRAKEAAKKLGVRELKLAITHSRQLASAIALIIY